MWKPSALEWTLIVAAAILLAFAVARSRNHSNAIDVPYTADTRLTPGVLNSDVTQKTIDRTICVRGWTRTIRPPSNYTSELKLRQMRDYGSIGTPSDYQEDHLVSLELGGHPTDPRNLWPEPRPRAEQVDSLENELNDRICSGSITLAEGQERIRKEKYSKG
jgi:hypothetical protein